MTAAKSYPQLRFFFSFPAGLGRGNLRYKLESLNNLPCAREWKPARWGNRVTVSNPIGRTRASSPRLYRQGTPKVLTGSNNAPNPPAERIDNVAEQLVPAQKLLLWEESFRAVPALTLHRVPRLELLGRRRSRWLTPQAWLPRVVFSISELH